MFVMASILLPYRQIKGSLNRKVLPKCGRKKELSDLVFFFFFSPSIFVCITCVLLSCFESVWFYAMLCFNMFLFVCFQFCLILLFIKKKKKSEKYKNNVCFVYICTCVP